MERELVWPQHTLLQSHRALSSLGEPGLLQLPTQPCHQQPDIYKVGRVQALGAGQLALRPALPSTNCGIWGKLLDLSEPISHL